MGKNLDIKLSKVGGKNAGSFLSIDIFEVEKKMRQGSISRMRNFRNEECEKNYKCVERVLNVVHGGHKNGYSVDELEEIREGYSEITRLIEERKIDKYSYKLLYHKIRESRYIISLDK